MDEKIIDALNDCLERLARGEALEAVLSRYPESRRELEPLLQASLVTRKALAGIAPPPGARARVWTHLQPAMKGGSRPRYGPLAWLRPWAVAATSLFLVFLLAGGTVLASTNSLPHQPLYPVKLAAEQVHLALTPTQAGKASLEIALAEKRAREMVAVAQLNRPEELEKLAQRLESHLEKVAGPAVEVPPSPSPSPSPQAFTERGAEGVAGLAATPPPPSPQPVEVPAPPVAATPEGTPIPPPTPASAIAPTPERVPSPAAAPGAAPSEATATPHPTPTDAAPGPPPWAEARVEEAKPDRAGPERTATPEATPTPARTPTPRPTPTATPAPTPTPPTPKVSDTPEATHTPKVLATPSPTLPPVVTATPRATLTPMVTAPPRATATPTPTRPPEATKTVKPEPEKTTKGEKPELEARLEEGARLQDQLLEEYLEKVPPQAREALRQALEKNRDSYEKALKRLQEKRDEKEKD